jgi:hypothetical protein
MWSYFVNHNPIYPPFHLPLPTTSRKEGQKHMKGRDRDIRKEIEKREEGERE